MFHLNLASPLSMGSIAPATTARQTVTRASGRIGSVYEESFTSADRDAACYAATAFKNRIDHYRSPALRGPLVEADGRLTYVVRYYGLD